MEQDPNKIKGIAGLLFIVGALVMTFAVPLTMVDDLPPMLFGFGNPVGDDEMTYNIGRGVMQGVAQEVRFDRNVEIQYLKVYMKRNPSAGSDFEVGISPTLNKADIVNLVTIPVYREVPVPVGYWDKHWELIEIPKTTLEANRSYYIVFYANETQDIQADEVYRSRVATRDLATYLMRSDMTNMPETDDEAIFWKSDVALKIYGEYVTIVEEEEKEEAEQTFMEQPKNQVLIIGSILFAIGFGILFSMLELPMIADNILILVGISALVGILWFVFVANPWMVMNVAGMIGGK